MTWCMRPLSAPELKARAGIGRSPGPRSVALVLPPWGSIVLCLGAAAKRRARVMINLETVRPGLTGTAELIVGPEHTAPRVGSGRIAVLATPVMINVIEAAALAAV